jgi:hypothetical protein
VACEHSHGLRLARPPERDTPVLTRGGDAAIRQIGDRVDRSFMEAQHLDRRIALERPADRRRIEAAGHRERAVGRDRQRPHRSAMAAQLCLCARSNRDRQHANDDNNKPALDH